jgi:NAD dependent epimerase/dehydratase
MNYGGKRVYVTGADGFIGSHLAEALVAAGAKVTALAQYNSFDSAGWLDDLTPAVRETLTIHRGDIRDAAFMRQELDGQDVVFHLAALIAIPYSYMAAGSYVDTNVHGTLNVLEAVRRNAVGRMIHTSTSEVYGTAQFTPITETHPLQGQSPYSASKIGADMMVEAYARSFETPASILRPFNTYGPRQSERAVIPTIIRQALDPACAEIRIGDDRPKRDFNYVGDTVEAFLALGASETAPIGKPLNTGTGIAVQVADVIAAVRDLTGTNKPVVTEADRQRPAESEVMLLLAGSQALQDATGWRPKTSLQDGLRKTIAWWERRIAEKKVRPSSGYAT